MLLGPTQFPGIAFFLKSYKNEGYSVFLFLTSFIWVRIFLVRRHIVREEGVAAIEMLMFDEHHMIKRAATEAMCNMILCEEVSVLLLLLFVFLFLL